MFRSKVITPSLPPPIPPFWIRVKGQQPKRGNWTRELAPINFFLKWVTPVDAVYKMRLWDCTQIFLIKSHPFWNTIVFRHFSQTVWVLFLSQISFHFGTVTSHTTNEGPLRIQNKCLIPIYVLPVCGTRLLSATRPSKLINGCQGHPLFCLSPGTTQRQRNPEEKRMNAQSLYSVGICRQSRYAV